MKLRKLKPDADFAGKRVLIRINADVPIKNGKVVDGPHGRIARAAVDIDWLSQRGAKVIVLAHLGRPNGKRIAAYSLKPVARRLTGLLKSKIQLSRDVIGPRTTSLVEKMIDGDVVLLENLRFDIREQENAPSFAQALAALGDLYVNDAFSDSHRAHASVDAIASELPSFAGPLLANEISVLSKLDKHTKQPFVLVMGGLKFETKLPVITRYLSEVDTVLIGGALATTFFVANGFSVGKSVYDETSVDAIKKLLAHAKEKILIPVDVVVTRSLRKDAKTRVVTADKIRATERIVDIGPATIALFENHIAEAKTVIWNGPLGYCEIPKFAKGSVDIAKAIAERTGSAMTIVGGGDTVPLLEAHHLADKFTLLSTGGGALLEYLAGKKLPGLEVLETE